jgi:hypothetical protein
MSVHPLHTTLPGRNATAQQLPHLILHHQLTCPAGVHAVQHHSCCLKWCCPPPTPRHPPISPPPQNTPPRKPPRHRPPPPTHLVRPNASVECCCELACTCNGVWCKQLRSLGVVQQEGRCTQGYHLGTGQAAGEEGGGVKKQMWSIGSGAIDACVGVSATATRTGAESLCGREPMRCLACCFDGVMHGWLLV